MDQADLKSLKHYAEGGHYYSDCAQLALDQLEALTAFFKWAMWQEGDWCDDVLGEDLQDKAEELGLIEKTIVTEPCCEQCACAEVWGEFPVECYRYTLGEEE